MGSKPQMPVVLTIAGTDPSGGAGIQADLKTFTSLFCYGTSVITAVVAQNTTGVQDVHSMPPSFVSKQMRSVVEDLPVKAIKTGMLFDDTITHAVCNTLSGFYKDSNLIPIIVDPVCVSTSGHTLLKPDTLGTIIRELFPLAYIITPNRQEAEQILSWNKEKYCISSCDDMLQAAVQLAMMGPRNVLLKGGHLTTRRGDLETLLRTHSDIQVVGDQSLQTNMEVLKEAATISRNITISPEDELVVDVLYEEQAKKHTLFVRRRLVSSSTHGTGCTLSASLACFIAMGYDVSYAVGRAIDYTHAGIQTASGLGHGNGPLNHMHSIVPRAILDPSPSHPFPFVEAMIRFSEPDWSHYVQHQFVHQVGKGTLPVENFKHFIKQDYIYLKYYARAYGLLAVKAVDYERISAAARIILSIATESKMHEAFCATWNITPEDLQRTPESIATSAYGGYLLNIGLQGDFLSLMVAFMACLIGYGEVGLWIVTQSKVDGSGIRVAGNPYEKWITDYAGEWYQKAVRDGIDALESLVQEEQPSTRKVRELQEIWKRCTLLEKSFWEMAMQLT